jgi:hypothetical protein
MKEHYIGAIPVKEAVETIKKYIKARKGVDLTMPIYYYDMQHDLTGHMFRVAKKWLDDEQRKKVAKKEI